MTDSCPAAADRIDPNAARKKSVTTFRVLLQNKSAAVWRQTPPRRTGQTNRTVLKIPSGVNQAGFRTFVVQDDTVLTSATNASTQAIVKAAEAAGLQVGAFTCSPEDYAAGISAFGGCQWHSSRLTSSQAMGPAAQTATGVARRSCRSHLLKWLPYRPMASAQYLLVPGRMAGRQRYHKKSRCGITGQLTYHPRELGAQSYEPAVQPDIGG